MSHDPPSRPPLPALTLEELFAKPEPLTGEAARALNKSPLSAAELDQLRRSLDLRVDAEGHWWHEGERFTHPRLISYFNRQLGWRGGEATLTIGERWCYVGCDITPFLTLKLELNEEGAPLALLNTGERLPLDALELRGDILFAQLRPDRLARWSRHAQAQCAAWLREARDDEPAASSGFVLDIQGRVWPITLDSMP